VNVYLAFVLYGIEAFGYLAGSLARFCNPPAPPEGFLMPGALSRSVLLAAALLAGDGVSRAETDQPAMPVRTDRYGDPLP
jgi:hypothetical protein